MSEILNALAKSIEHRQQLAQDPDTLLKMGKYLCTEDRNLQSGVCRILSSLCDHKGIREELVHDFKIVQRVCMLLADDSSDLVSQDIRSWSCIIVSKLMRCDKTKLQIAECKVPLAGAKRNILGNAEKTTTTLERLVMLSRSEHARMASCASDALRTLVFKDDTNVLSLQLLQSEMNLSQLFLLADAAVPEVSCGAIELLATMVERGVMPFEVLDTPTRFLFFLFARRVFCMTICIEFFWHVYVYII